MCSDDSTAKRKTWTQGRKTALKEVLQVFVQSVKDSQGVGITEYDNTQPYKYKYPKAHQKDRMSVRPVRTEILNNMSKRLEIRRQKASEHMTYLRDATDVAVKHVYKGKVG